MAEKRKSPRVALRVIVKFGTEDPPAHTAFLTDLSESGVCIQSNKVYNPGTAVHLSIDINGVDHRCEGVVAWAKKVPQQLAHAVKNGMGIKFTRTDPNLMAHYRAKAAG